MTSPSESLLRSALLKDELAAKGRRRRVPEPIKIKRRYEEDEEDEVITPSSLSARAPSPSFGWLWREDCEEEDDTPQSSRPKSPTPRVRSQTTPCTSRSPSRTRTASADGAVPLSFSPVLKRHAWSADSVPKSQMALRLELDHDKEPESPRTPSKSFCARSASQTIKDVPGLVSFGDVEGLGMPDESDDDDTRDDKADWKKKWLHWGS